MKMLCGLFSLGFAVLTASAGDIEKRRAEETGKKFKEYKTASGQVYRDVTITKITDAGISITHADGSARLRFEHLKAEQREEFGITQGGAEAIYAKELKARAAYEAQVAAKQKERQKAHEELFAKQTAALLEAERLEAQRAQKQQVATNIESTLEIPGFPMIRGSNNEILNPIQSYSPCRRSVYYRSTGGFYPSSSGGYYHPGYHHHYSPSRTSCTTNQPRSIFNITIK